MIKNVTFSFSNNPPETLNKYLDRYCCFLSLLNELIFFCFTGELFKKQPFFTCWSRKNEEGILPNLTISKTAIQSGVPRAFDTLLEFRGYDTPLNCSGSIKNPSYHEIWTTKASRLLLKHNYNTTLLPNHCISLILR